MEDPVIIITGANNGIGYHLTTSLLKEGYRVAALDLSGENLIPLQNAYPDRLIFRHCDVTDDVQVRTAVGSVIERWGRIDVLVNNACLATFKPFEEENLGQIRREFEVNYFGYVRMIAAVVPYMKAQGGGIIHNMSSGVGITGFPGLSGYASTKGAIEALARTLALELAPYGIRVTLMHPPLTDTRSAAPLGIPSQAMADPADVGHKLARRILSARPVITPDLRTAVYLFLARRFPEAVGKLFAKLSGL
ncbi:MAG: SDR family NAD(P)-dependent oxidoreductase [Chloroflexi bacterium]|nr:SDR family NAD(P)-dependent oxidoreductase [Chloroflexota bacterium]